MKKVLLSFVFTALACIGLTLCAQASDFTADTEGKYTITIPGKTAGKDYTLVIVAGDYTDKEAPEISEKNIIYIDQVKADETGTVSFTALIPMTESVGTIYIGGDDTPVTEGILMTESGFGYIAGRIISYSGNQTTVVIPKEFDSVAPGTFEEADCVQNIIVQNADIEFDLGAFAEGTKVFLSPLASIGDNDTTFMLLGDFNNNKTVDCNDYKEMIESFAVSGTLESTDNTVSFDFDFDGRVTLRDMSVLLQIIGGKITDYKDALVK